MTTRLPYWTEYGAFALALLAGTINAIGFLDFQHQAVSHVSGLVTSFGISIIDQPSMTLHLAGVLLGFLAGATLSGIINTNTSLMLGRHYGVLLFIESMLLLAALICLQNQLLSGHYFASAACGLQNAMATTYSGAIVRTTHMTGIFTDLGIMFGNACRGYGFDRRKAFLFLILVLGFIAGGVSGALLYRQWQVNALLAPIATCLFLAAGYHYLSRRTRQATRV